MPLDPLIQAEVDAYLASVILKKRIPELPDASVFGAASLLDEIALWMNGVDKTVHIDLLTLKSIMTTGGTGTVVPSLVGNTLPIVITAAEAGGDTVLRPELEGKTYFLRLEGRPMILNTDWQLLSGGFKMLNPGSPDPYELVEGQRFDAQIYELMSTTGGPAALSSSFITGIVTVSANETLNGVNHANKLIQIRGGGTHIVVTLPDLASTPENAFLCLETVLGNTVQQRITTQGGQLIYMNNSSWINLHMGVGEVLWLRKGSDGWYMLNNFGDRYLDLGHPVARYSHIANRNEIFCDGTNYAKADVPRLWEAVQTFGGSLVSDTTVWNNNKGLYLDVDTNTLRVPDLRNLFLRGVKTEGGSDAQRALNVPGGFQDEAMNVPVGVTGVKVTGSNTVVNVDSVNPGGNEFDLTTGFSITPKQGPETRPVNSGVMWVIKI
jgi:hypothetical protein